MLMPYLPILNKKKIILGSQSKSRKFLVQAQVKGQQTQKINFECFSSKFAQDLDKNSFQTPDQYNMQTCKGKVVDLLQTFKTNKKQWDLLICGDTIVCHGGKIIQKPIDKKDCVQMMSALANQTHQAYTAHIIVFNTEPQIKYQWVTKADVTFGDVPTQCFQAFAETDQPYIHSGGYELTAISGSFIKSIGGSFTAVQGLDMYQLCRKIIDGSKKAGWI